MSRDMRSNIEDMCYLSPKEQQELYKQAMMAKAQVDRQISERQERQSITGVHPSQMVDIAAF